MHMVKSYSTIILLQYHVYIVVLNLQEDACIRV